ncbi:hypothetical protein SCLCIDRAFT_118751, partial [Scleroderma citrinum Foug A]
WGKEHVKEMLDFLIDKLPEMGDGEFKMQTWNQVAVHMRSKFPLAEGEGERTAESCRSKFTRLKEDFVVVKALKSASGFHFSEERGACIMLETQDTWLDFVKHNQGSSKFHNKGFDFYDEMLQLVPHKAQGKG